MTTQEAVKTALAHVNYGVYMLGTGDCDTPKDGQSDCAGFAFCKCWGLRRHRPGFNKGAWASIEDDINCNSAIEDADHHKELFVPIDRPELGAFLIYPTFYLKGHPKPWIGHVAIVVAVPPEWDPALSKFAELTVVQCCGPDLRKPGILKTSGVHWDNHDKDWPNAEHRTRLIKVK